MVAIYWVRGYILLVDDRSVDRFDWELVFRAEGEGWYI